MNMMETQKFRGATLQEAVEAAQRQCGPEAMVMHVQRQNVPGSVFRRRKEWVEVIARAPERDPAGLPAVASPSGGGSILEEIHALRDELNGFGSAIRQMERITWARGQVERNIVDHPMLNFLVERGMNSESALELLADWSRADATLDLQHCMTDLDRRLPRLRWEELFPSEPGCCTLLVGLPGVGKTLMLLKIAARLRLGGHSEVILVSADMSRPGPSQELNLYSELLGIRVVDIFDLSEVRRIAEEGTARTHLLVDWNGISPYSRESWEALEQLRHLHWHPQLLLAASLASDLRNWQYLRNQFSHLPLVGLALTQADLEHRVGKIWEAVHGTNLPLALISTGKNVPGDLCEAGGFPFAQLLFRGYSAMTSATC